MRNNKVIGTMMFLAGVAIGVAGTWQYFKTKYGQLAQEEIASVKESRVKKDEGIERKPSPDEVPASKTKIAAVRSGPPMDEYAKMVRERKYTNYAGRDGTEGDDDEGPSEEPYVITPEEFGNEDEYEKISLTYFADKVLTDDQNNPIADVEDLVGADSLETFGEYEDDSVFVRNHKYKCDYEILLDQRRYSDMIADQEAQRRKTSKPRKPRMAPHQTED